MKSVTYSVIRLYITTERRNKRSPQINLSDSDRDSRLSSGWFVTTVLCLVLFIITGAFKPPTERSTSPSAKQTRTSCNSGCLSRWSPNITRFERLRTRAADLAQVRLLQKQMGLRSIHRTVASVWNLVCLTAAAANAQREQARVRLELRLCFGAE